MKLSLPAKFALLALVIAGTGVLGISYFSFRDASTLLRQLSIQQLAEGLNRDALLFNESLGRMRSDLSTLSHSEPVQGYIRADEGGGYDDLGNMTVDLWKQRLATNFTFMLKQHPEYDQIRYIGLADNGREIVRVKRHEGRIAVVKDNNLQQKGDRDYVEKTARLKADQQYVSYVDLNREHGEIVFPLRPVLRMAAPVVSKSGTVFGVVVINASFDALAQVFMNSPDNVDYLIANSSGDYILHPNKEKLFAVTFGKEPGLINEFPEIDWSQLNYKKDKYTTFNLPERTASLIVQSLYIDPLDDEHRLILIAFASHVVIEEKSVGFGERLLVGVLAVVVILSLFMALLAKQLMAPIKVLTVAADKIADGEDNVEIPVFKGEDELGKLAQSFRTMLGRVSRSRNKLRALADNLERKVDERTEELAEAMNQADAANRAKSEFLASMSHDLRTPLNAIMGFSEMMRMKTFGPLGDPRYEEYANDIHSSGTLLVSLINDVLDLSKIEARKYQLIEETLSISELVQSSFKQLQNMADISNQTLSSDIPSGMSALLGDERVMIQILNNLLSNAIKFTPEGGEISVDAKLDKGNSIILRVIDTGIGMSDEEIIKVLNPFEQTKSTHSRRHEGTGLGLHLCRNFMKLFGGTLKIESKVGVGTTVTLCFPPERTISPA